MLASISGLIHRKPAPVQEDDPLRYKVVVEMAGKANRDRISLGIRADAEQSFADFTATPQVDTAKGHRSLAVMDNVEQTPYELYIQIPMSGADPLQLSLNAAVQPVEETVEKDEWDNVLVPIKPLAYMTEYYSRDKSALLAKGYVYVFWQDKLWRELEVTKRTGFKDTEVLSQLEAAADGAIDTSDTTPRPGISPEHSYLWMPYKIAGAVQSDIQIGYSRRSWTLDKITELEGDAGKRDEFTTTIDLSVYSQQQGFNAGVQGQPGDVEPIKTLLTTQTAADEDEDLSFARDEAPLSSDRYAGIPGVYLDATNHRFILNYEYGVHAGINEDDVLILTHNESDWQQEVKVADRNTHQLVKEENSGWLKAVFEEVPQTGTFTLVNIHGHPDSAPTGMFTERELVGLDDEQDEVSAAPEAEKIPSVKLTEQQTKAKEWDDWLISQV